MKHLVLLLSVVVPVIACAQIPPAIKDKEPAVFFADKNNQDTAVAEFSRSFQFVAGNSPAVRLQGDTAYTNVYLINKTIKVWRNGLYQYTGIPDGVKFDHVTGRIIFYPRLAEGETIYIEALNGF